MKKVYILFFGYVFLIILLFLYSYTQVDLDLTLIRFPFFHHLITSFQYIGYFQRSLSTYLYVSLVVLLFVFYFLLLKFAENLKITKKQLWILTIVTTFILTFSYNAFSYDIFNYIFDARIITHYHQNPYMHKALDYPGDPMLSFMRWTHRIYPYGPFWLALTVPLSFIGFQVFVVTFLLFKILMSASFIGSAYYLDKISQKIYKKNSVIPFVLFAFNPLVIMESVISDHLDIVMMFFCLYSFYLLLDKKTIRSFIFLILSIGIKFATAFLLPVYFLYLYYKNAKNKPDIFLLYPSLILMIAAIILETYRTNFQPWYLLIVLPFASLLWNKYFITIPMSIITFMVCLWYVPYLYTGNWNPPIPMILSGILYTSVFLSVLSVLFYKFCLRRFIKAS